MRVKGEIEFLVMINNKAIYYYAQKNMRRADDAEKQYVNNPSGGESVRHKVEKNSPSLSESNSILINFDDSKNTNTTMMYKPIAHEGERGNRIYGNDRQQGDLHG